MRAPTPSQMRAARGLMNWSRAELSSKSGVSELTIHRFENGTHVPSPATREKLTQLFEAVGIEFIENEGLRRLPIGIEIFDGLSRFQDFLDFMYEYLDRFSGEVCVSVTDECYLQRATKDINAHRATMHKLVQAGKTSGRILAARGFFKDSWSQIRHQNLAPDMPQVSFITFGNNLGLISFDDASRPYVVLHKSSPFAIAYKVAFDAAWEKSASQ